MGFFLEIFDISSSEKNVDGPDSESNCLEIKTPGQINSILKSNIIFENQSKSIYYYEK